MANDSQRGYLSGILQRGARTPSPTAPPNPVRPFMPSPVPFLDRISSDLHAIETFLEPTHPQKSSGSEAVAEQPNRPTQVLSQEAERQPTTNPPPDSPNWRQAAASDNRAVFSSPPPASADALPVLSPVNADLKSTERNEWGDRLPRLIGANDDEVRGNSINAAGRTNNRNGDQRTLAEAASRVDSSVSQNTQTASTLQAASHQEASVTEALNLRDGQSPKLKRIESRDAEVTSLRVQNSQTSQVELLQSLGESNQPAELLALRAEPSEQSREVVVEQVAAGQRDQSVIWSPAPAPRDGFSGGAARQQSPFPRAEAPKLTINRLDVQIVNHSVPSVVQLPIPAPVPQLDGWENLERYHLGHLDLIF